MVEGVQESLADKAVAGLVIDLTSARIVFFELSDGQLWEKKFAGFATTLVPFSSLEGSHWNLRRFCWWV